jgi:type IV secretory pathway TrbL component
MDFNSILQWLQSMIGNQQSTGASQYNSALGLGQQELSQQGTEFSSNLALQKQIQDQANALAQAQQAQSSQQQGWAQGQEAPQNTANTTATNQRNAEIQAMMNSPWMVDQSGVGNSFRNNLYALLSSNYGSTPSSVTTK